MTTRRVGVSAIDIGFHRDKRASEVDFKLGKYIRGYKICSQ